MSLNWNVGNIEGFKDWGWYTVQEDDPSGFHNKGDELMNPVTHTLTHITMVIGLGLWTAKNIDEVFYRIRSYELLCGPLLCRVDDLSRSIATGVIREDTFDGPYISRAEVVRHVGLSTNVSNETNAYWNKHLGEIARRSILK